LKGKRHKAEKSSRRDGAVWMYSVVSALLFCLLAWHAGKLEAANQPPQSLRTWVPRDAQIFASRTTSHIAIADFDGDLQPDVATVESGSVAALRASYRIRFELSRGTEQSIGVVAAAGGLQIWPQDVNGDNFPDLMISSKWLHEPVAILLNDGHGNFTVAAPGTFPQAKWGNETNLAAAGSDEKESVEFDVSRSPAGESAENGGGFQSQPSRELLKFIEAEKARFLAHLFGLERAPPLLIHQA
jgi:hypothetical protein